MKGAKSPDQVDVEVGQRIRVQRLAIGMSQTTLAEALGVTFQQVQKYEKGVNRVGAGRLTKIATVLRVPVASLLGADDRTGRVREQPDGIGTPLKLLTIPGALKLLRAFNNLPNGKMRRSIVQHVENIAALGGRGSKRL